MLPIPLYDEVHAAQGDRLVPAAVEHIVFTLYLVSRRDVVQMFHREPWANQRPMSPGAAIRLHDQGSNGGEVVRKSTPLSQCIGGLIHL